MIMIYDDRKEESQLAQPMQTKIRAYFKNKSNFFFS